MCDDETQEAGRNVTDRVKAGAEGLLQCSFSNGPAI